MAAQEVLYEVRGECVVITLNRPDVHNAFNDELISDILVNEPLARHLDLHNNLLGLEQEVHPCTLARVTRCPFFWSDIVE